METNDKYIGQLLDGRYEISEVIGEGGMAVVYKALDHRLNRNVAVKIMRDDMAKDEEFRRRFCAESHAVAMLSHPNIVAVYDVSHSDIIEYIVMELVDGITLRQYMDKKGAISWREALHFTKQIAKALMHAHERGIIHRDIKPQNIMLLRDGTIKVGDFGIAALENEIHENNGQAIGSVHYIAPEQARGEFPDARSDIYSLGISMYEMLTGKKPYDGDSIGEIAVKHMNAEPDAPRSIKEDIPEELERIALKAMTANINERYQSAAEFIEDLDEFTRAQLAAEREEKTLQNPDVIPIRSVSELTHDKYLISRRRSNRVTFMSGALGALLMCIGLFGFIWNFWLKEVFSPAERMDLPNFVGYNLETIVNNAELSTLFKFNVTYVIDTENESGLILTQNPMPGRSMMITPDGIQVELTVSTGMVSAPVPEIVNLDYREARTLLQQSGFIVDIENEQSDNIAKDIVISCYPNAGENLSAGSTVYITVSSGPYASYVQMPNLIGLSETAAVKKLESVGLSYGSSERVRSEVDAGTVIGQSVDAFTQIEEHTKISLRISTGPEG